MIYTIGYQKLTQPLLFKIMVDRGINLLIDIRCKPYGRKVEFNRKSLEVAFKNQYAWWGNTLGGFCGPVSDDAVRYLVNLAAKIDGNVLLMCMEDDPRKCHRYYDISKRLLLNYNMNAIHIVGASQWTTTQLNKEEASHE